jgi:hypothetical protein
MTNHQYKNQFSVVGYDTCRYVYWIAKAGASHPARTHTLSQVTQWEFARDLLKRNWFDKSNSEANGGTQTEIEAESDEVGRGAYGITLSPWDAGSRERNIPPQPGRSTLLERHESSLETAKAVDLEWAVQSSLILQSMVEDLVAKEVKTTGLGEFGLSRLVETNFSPVGLHG